MPPRIRAIATEREETRSVALGAPRDVLDVRVGEPLARKLRAHRPAQIHVGLVSGTSRDDLLAMTHARDLCGNVDANLEAARPDARPNRRHETPRPRGARICQRRCDDPLDDSAPAGVNCSSDRSIERSHEDRHAIGDAHPNGSGRGEGDERVGVRLSQVGLRTFRSQDARSMHLVGLVKGLPVEMQRLAEKRGRIVRSQRKPVDVPGSGKTLAL